MLAGHIGLTEISHSLIKVALQHMCPQLTIEDNLIPSFRKLIADMLRYRILLAIVKRSWIDDGPMTTDEYRTCKWKLVCHGFMLTQKYGLQLSVLTGMWGTVKKVLKMRQQVEALTLEQRILDGK